jgi:hypothetical protein
MSADKDPAPRCAECFVWAGAYLLEYDGKRWLCRRCKALIPNRLKVLFVCPTPGEPL